MMQIADCGVSLLFRQAQPERAVQEDEEVEAAADISRFLTVSPEEGTACRPAVSSAAGTPQPQRDGVFQVGWVKLSSHGAAGITERENQSDDSSEFD